MRSGVLAYLAAAAFACSPSVLSAPAPTDQPVPARAKRPHALLVSIDGLRPADLDDPHAKIPTLRALMKTGAVADGGVETVRPSLTYPAHATMLTGVSPARHGIVANLPPDPKGSNQDGWYWYASDLRAPTIWQVAQRAGLTTASVYFPITVGADVTFNVPQVWRAKNEEDDKLLLALTTPSLAADLRAAKSALPSEHGSDLDRARMVEYVIRRTNANLTLAYFEDLDTAEHDHGPGSTEALRVLAGIDGYLARIVNVAREQDPNVNIVVVSDHGFVKTTREFRSNVALREGGFMQLDEAGKIRSWVAASWRWNGSGAILLRDPSDAATKLRVGTYLRRLAEDPENGIARVVDPSERPELSAYPEVGFVLEMHPGTIVAGKTTGPRVVISTDQGAHGYDPRLPEMRATLILAGPSVKPGALLRGVKMADVAPTIAALLGLDMPDVEGRVLAEALR